MPAEPLPTIPDAADRPSVTEPGTGEVAAAPHRNGAVRRRPRRRPMSRRRLRLYAVALGVGLVGLSSLGALVVAALVQEVPPWWRTVNAQDPATRRLGSDMFNRATTTIWSRRPMERPEGAGEDAPATSEPWTFEVTVAEANAWLNADLPRWLENQSDTFNWPRQISILQVDFSGDRIAVAVELKLADSSQVLAARVTPRFGEDGSLWVPADWVHIGRLPVPASWILSERGATLAGADEKIPANIRELPETKAILDALAGRVPVMDEPVLKLGDGRRVRVIGFSAKEGRLVITCLTEQR